MKFAVIGAAGQLGRDLCPRLPGEVIALGRDRADLANPELLRQTFRELRPGVVINCAAYNFVDKAETEPEVALAVNAWGTRTLAKLCAEHHCTLVHFSTDYVFGLDATRSTPYSETDAPGPVSVYGISKLAGEYLVQSLCTRHFVIRTCGLYGVWGSGGKGGNFVETMLRVAGQGKPLRVVADQVCTPTYTVDLAEATARLIATGNYGLYHLVSEGGTTWHDFAAAIFAEAGIAANLTPISTEEFKAPAGRPPYSVLSTHRYQRLGQPALRPWRAALKAYLEERRQRTAAS